MLRILIVSTALLAAGCSDDGTSLPDAQFSDVATDSLPNDVGPADLGSADSAIDAVPPDATPPDAAIDATVTDTTVDATVDTVTDTAAVTDTTVDSTVDVNLADTTVDSTVDAAVTDTTVDSTVDAAVTDTTVDSTVDVNLADAASQAYCNQVNNDYEAQIAVMKSCSVDADCAIQVDDDLYCNNLTWVTDDPQDLALLNQYLSQWSAGQCHLHWWVCAAPPGGGSGQCVNNQCQ